MATFRYTLRTPDAVVQFGTDQVRNWQDVKPSIVKNRTYRGVFQTMTSTIEFVDQIRDLIIRTVDDHGYDVGIFLTIEIGNDNRERSSFRTFEGLSDMKAEISEIDITELAVSLNFIESGFVSDILNRESIKVNLDVAETIDGDTILPSYESLLQELYLHDRRLVFNTLLETEDVTNVYPVIPKGTAGLVYNSYVSIPLTITYKSDSRFQNVISRLIYANVPPVTTIDSFYLNSDKDRYIEFNLKLDCTISANAIGSPKSDYLWRIGLWRIRGGSATMIKDIASSAWFSGNYPNMINGASINIDETYSTVLDIEEGDSYNLMLMIEPWSSTAVNTNDFTLKVNYASIEGTSLEKFPDTTAKSLKPHELFERLIHIITGEKNAFYSDYFGRKDLGYEKDGEGAYLSVLNGLMIRGFPDGETHLNTSFKEAFEAFSKEKNLVGTVQTINNKKVFRIEKYDNIYIQKVSLKLGAVLDVSRVIDYERIFSEIKTGGKDEEYEEVNGLYSFNGEFNFATPLQTSASILNLISPYRKDDIGIELTRRLQYESDPTKDYRADKDIFIIDAYLSNGMLYARRAEQYSVVNGIYEAQYVYNLSLSPVRQLMLWGNVISSGLLQKIDKSLKFTKGAKNQDLESQKIGGSLIVESDDIPILELAKPIILPDDILIAEAKMTFDEYRVISEKTTHLIEFENKGVTIFGYISNAEFDFERNLCNFEIERANY